MCWYSNKATTSRGNESKPATAATLPIKKPRATNAEDLFAKSLQTELCTAVESKMQQASSTTFRDNLNVYHDVKKKAFDDLSDADKAHWRDLAEEHNKKIKASPSADYIFKYVLLSVGKLFLLISLQATKKHRR